MTRALTTPCDGRLPACRCPSDSGQCFGKPGSSIPLASENSAEVGPPEDTEAELIELDDLDPNEELADDALLELDGPDDDEPLPEYGDFWIDTDDVDAV